MKCIEQIIKLEQLVVSTNIGVYDWETTAQRQLVLDVELSCSPGNPDGGTTDQLEHALDYSQVAELVTRIAAHAQYNLLEALSDHLAEALLSRWSEINELSLSLYKDSAVPNCHRINLKRRYFQGTSDG